MGVLLFLVAGCGDNKTASTDAAIVAGPDGLLPTPVFSQTAYIKSAEPLHDSNFGWFRLSGAGDTLVAGENGAVTVYERDPTWRVSAELVPSPAAPEFGPHVAISNDGSTIAVAAQYADDAGEVFVFRKSGETWTQDARLRDVNALGDPLPNVFLVSLALSSNGETLVLGSRDPFDGTGRVRTYDRGDGSWPQVASLGGTETDFDFGHPLALAPQGDVLAVSALRSVPVVEIYVRTANTWTLRATVPSMIDSSGSFGTDIACSAECKTLAIGAVQEPSMLPSGTGVTYMFEGDGSTWSPTVTLTATNADIGDAFGNAVALSADGSTLVTGAPKEFGAGTGINSDGTDNSAPYAGAAYVFRRSGRGWQQVMYLKASNAETVDIFGSEVGISNDGATIVVAAPYEAGASSGVNGDQADDSVPYAGAVYAFEGTY